MVGLMGATTPPQVREPIHSCPCASRPAGGDIDPVFARLGSNITLLPGGLKIPKAVRPGPG